MGKHPLNLALRFLLELAGLAIFAIWAWSVSSSWWRLPVVIFLPLLFASLWGIFAVKGDPSRSGKTVIPTKGTVRLFLEFLFFGLAILALFHLQFKTPGIVFAILVFVHYALSYDRIAWLLKN